MLSFVAPGAIERRPKKDPGTVRFQKKKKDKKWRRYFWVVLAGKMIGVFTVGAIIFLFIKFFGSHAGATTTDPTVITGTPNKTDTIQINAINTTWPLVTAFLVFF